MKLTEKTLFSLSAVTLIGGGIAWAANMQALTNTNKQQIEDLQHEAISTRQLLLEIKSDVSFIKGKLERNDR